MCETLDTQVKLNDAEKAWLITLAKEAIFNYFKKKLLRTLVI
jgi:hypothetical protein